MASDILIVDDEADIRELVSGILEDEGHGTRLAKDSDETLAVIEQRRPSLVILDIWLQGSKLDGLELLDRIKRAHPDLPVVIISGHGNIETAVAAIRRGAYDYIEKPFKADRLVLITARALEASRLKRENRELRERSAYSFDMVGRSTAIRHLVGAIGRLDRHQPGAPGHRKGGSDQQPSAHQRTFGLRQRARRSRHAYEIRPRRRPLRRAECSGHGARPRGA